MKQIRAIVYGIGRVNQIAARLLMENGIEIVGAINRPGPKIGRDLGEISGLSPLGISISDRPADVLSIPADVVLVAVCDDMQRGFPIYKNCLEHGLNVVTVGAFMSYPWRRTPDLANELDALAKENGVSLVATGNQDFFMVNLGLLMSGVCHSIRHISHRSLSNINLYGPEVANLMCVGGHPKEFDYTEAGQNSNPYLPFWENVIDELELTVSDIKLTTKPILAEHDYFSKGLNCVIETGKIIGQSQELEISTKEGLQLIGSNALRLCAEDEEEYKTWQIDGEPGLKIRATTLDSVFTTASQAVNRIPDAISAKPGYITLKKLPKLIYKSRPFYKYIQKA